MTTTDAAAPHVPGYELVELVGSGAGGRVWRGRALAQPAADVAVKIVRGGPGAERELAVLRGVRHPHVVGLRDAVPLDDGRVALVLDLVRGGTLAQLVAARGHLRAGEVVTIVAPLARALADLHAVGIQHGDLAPGNVLFDAEGRPLLTDLGTVRITGEAREEQFGTPGYVDPVVVTGGRAGPPSDVYGLAALAWFALTGHTPPGALLRERVSDAVPGLDEDLAAVLEEALDPDPAGRPAPDAFARRVFDAVPAEPIWVVGSAPSDGGLTHRIRQLAAADEQRAAPPRHRAVRRRSPRRRCPRLGLPRLEIPLLRGPRLRAPRLRAPRLAPARVVFVLLGVTTVVLLAVVAGLSGRSGVRVASASESSVAAETLTPVTPADAALARPGALTDATAREVVQRLSDRRARAFTEADPAVLSAAVTPGSPADRLARSSVTTLQHQGVRYEGLQLRVRSVQVRRHGPGTADVDVLTDVSAYAVVDARGRVVRQVAGQTGSASRLQLAWTRQGWRVTGVQPG